MIITQKKPLEEVMAMVGDAKTVAVIGCGLCAGTCPEVFHMGDDGLAHGSGIPEGQLEAAQEARDGCPVSAISIEA